jgi:hypothetical protein
LEEGGVFGFELLGELLSVSIDGFDEVGVFEGEDLCGEETGIGGSSFANGHGGNRGTKVALGHPHQGIEALH